MAVAGEVVVVAAAADVAKAIIGTIIIRQRIEKPRHYIFFLFTKLGRAEGRYHWEKGL